MDASRVAVTAVVLAVLSAVTVGCTADRGPDASPPSRAATTELMVARPHFEGSLPVTLEAGTPVYADEACRRDPVRHRLCSADGNATWFTYPGSEAHLVEAEMAPTDNSTAWVVTLTFDSPAPVAVSRRALGLGAALFVVSADEVLVATGP